MATPAVPALSDLCDQIDQVRLAAFDALHSLKSADKPALDPQGVFKPAALSLSSLETRTTGLTELIRSIDQNADTTFIPGSLITTLIESLTQLNELLTGLPSQFNPLSEDGGIGQVNYDDGTVASANKKRSINLATLLKAIDQKIDTCLVNYYALLPGLESTKSIDFVSALQDITNKLNALRSNHNNLLSTIDASNQELNNIKALSARVAALKQDTDGFRSESEKSRKTIAEYEAEVTQKLTAVRQTATQAEALRTAVENYKTQFDQFQAQLKAREDALNQGKAEQERLFKTLHETEAEINRLVKKATDMLAGATVSGLASAFGAIRDQLSTQLGWARLGFYVSIVVLFICVLPLAIYVIPGVTLGGLITKGPTQPHASIEIGEVLVRALLVIPGAWLAKFAAARHSALFRLREHYAYKYSIAAAVEGFKQQAPTYEEAIAAATLFELTFNPANTMDGKAQETAHPNPAMEWIMKKMGATPNGKRA